MSIETNLSLQLEVLDAKLLQSVSFDDVIAPWCIAVCDVLNAERIGLFLANEDGVTISSTVTTGLADNSRVKLPIGLKA
jgi:hypothetical protein